MIWTKRKVSEKIPRLFIIHAKKKYKKRPVLALFSFFFTLFYQKMSKVYIVTGASRGLGLEFVKQIAAEGNIVFACARNPSGSKGLEALIDNKQVFGIKLDTTNSESIKVIATFLYN